MITAAILKDAIVANFADPRIASIQLFINQLISRKDHGNGIDQYRLTNKTTNAPITSIDDFLAAIDVTNINFGYYFYSDAITGDRVHPTYITLENISVSLNVHSYEDNVFRMQGAGEKILFLINYIADGDTVLPLKIYEVKLVSKNA